VRVALTASIASLPEQLRGSLTWDQGKEMAEHARFSIDSGVTVYFCDPHTRTPEDDAHRSLPRLGLPRLGPPGLTAAAI